MIIHYRTVWISDTHLGTKGCKAEYLRDFLDHDEQLRKHAGLQFNGVEIELNAIHKTHNGQRFLVIVFPINFIGLGKYQFFIT
jgi:UDP-2,3-diacylglucosamine pyrophosphatase LpxH